MTVIARMNVGGPAKLIDFLDRGLIDSGFEHVLVTGYCDKNEADYLNNNSLIGQIIYIETLFRKLNLFADLITIFKLKNIIKKVKPDIIHTHTAKAGTLGRLAALLSRKKNLKLVHTYHGHTLNGYFNSLQNSIFKNIERLLSLKTHVLISVSRNVMIELKKYGIGPNSNWQIIYPGIQISSENIKKNNFKRIIELIWIGRFTSIKNPMMAIFAYEELAKSFKIKLRMIGDGELKDDCKQYCSDKFLDIEFLGWQNDVRPFLNDANLLLITSKNEGLPVVMLEAASFKVSTLSTNVGGVNEFIISNQNGFLVNNKILDFQMKLRELLSQPDLITSTGLNAYKTVCNDFSVSNFVQLHLSTYRKLITKL